MTTRRRLLHAVALTPCGLRGVPAWADAAAVRGLIGDRPVAFEGMTLEMPRIAETGNSVPVTVSVDSPMTPADHVARLHVLVPGNPEVLAATFELGPAIGIARVSTRLRLARSQTVMALAELSDERVLGAELAVIVTLGACVEELWTD